MSSVPLAEEPLPEPVPSPGASGQSSPWIVRRQWPVLLLLLLAGLSLRVWYGSGFPKPERFWDEGYSFDNVRPILIHGRLETVSGYYPSPVVSIPPAVLMKISHEIYERTGREAFKTYEGGSIQPAGYLISRWLQAIYGTVGLWILFLIGRRMFSVPVGLIATLALAFCPWHIHASGYFKPDALLTTAVLLAFYGSLRVIETRRLRAAIGTGLAIALALSAKMTGGLIALPLTFATLLPAWRFDRRRFGLLALTGVVSAGVFVLTNPRWSGYLSVLSGLRRDYAMRADWGEQTRLSIPGKVVGLVVDGYGLGLIFGGLSLLGFVLLAVSVVRRQTPPMERIERGMLLVLPPIYVVTYALQTAYFKPNNFLHLLPLMALCGAWLAVAAWRELKLRWPLAARWPVAVLAIAVLLAVTVPAGWNYVYRSLTPTTYDVARRVLADVAGPAPGRFFYEERGPRLRTTWEGASLFARGRSALREVESLTGFAESRLDLTDGLVFPTSKLRSDQGDFYQRRLDRVPEKRRFTFGPKLFQQRGPEIIALAHRRAGDGPPIELTAGPCSDARHCLDAAVPAEAAGALVSMTVWISDATLEPLPGVPELAVGDQCHDLQWIRRLAKGHIFMTERFEIPDNVLTLQLHLGGPVVDEAKADIRLDRWERRTPDGTRKLPRAGS